MASRAKMIVEASKGSCIESILRLGSGIYRSDNIYGAQPGKFIS
jgi:hypothetical protein